MADSQQPPSSGNDAVGAGVGVGGSVVNDLMRVYENLTQSKTPQTQVPDASKALSFAYSNSGAPQSSAVPVYPPPPAYPMPPNAFQQQQQEPTAKNPMHIKSEPSAPTIPPSYNGGVPGPYPQQPPAGGPGYIPAPMAISAPDVSNGTQRSGEEPHGIVRTSSMLSKASVSSQNQHQPAADASSESDKSGGGRSRRKRKQQYPNDGGSTPGRGGEKKAGRGKKSKKEDGRWSKRFTWPEDLHRDFVSAIFDVGLKHSSPSTILEHMPKHEQITTERIKSHLQKYRLHRVKSKKEFISSYEASLRNFQQNQSNGGSTLVSGAGEVAAHLTVATSGKSSAGNGSKDRATMNNNSSSSDPNSKQHPVYQSSQNSGDGNDSLMLPQLTEAEKASPIGAAMGYLMGLFFSLKQQLIIQRSLEAAGEKAKGNALMGPSGTGTMAANNPAGAATAAAVAAGVEFTKDNLQQAHHPQQNGAMRSNIEANSMMKREMQNQMALQNKMRALKQQELDKYKNISKGVATPDAVMTTVTHDGTNPHLPVATASSMDAMKVEGTLSAGVVTSEQPPPTPQPPPQQPTAAATGEMTGTDLADGAQGGNNNTNTNLLGIDNSEDFWQNDVMDDQLFEFLLNS